MRNRKQTHWPVSHFLFRVSCFSFVPGAGLARITFRSRTLIRASLLSGIFTLLFLAPRPLTAACIGDCNADGAVTVDELLQGVNIALDTTPAAACTAMDANADGSVTIDELLAAVNAALNGCPINHPPAVPCFDIYRTYAGFDIQLPIDATDSDDDQLHYAARTLPDGAVLDERTGVFTWTPDTRQLGPFYVPFTVTDNGAPVQSEEGLLIIDVSPRDFCVQPTCDPATGCTATLIPLTQPCCIDLLPRVPEPVVGCPADRALFVGRNTVSGIGRLHNCDRLPVVNFGQTDAVVRLNVEARCINADQPVTLRARLVTNTRVVFDDSVPVTLDPAPNGSVQRTGLGFPVQTPGPFFDLEDADADLTVTLTDADGVTVRAHLRPTLTFTRLADLQDSDAPAPSPAPEGCP